MWMTCVCVCVCVCACACKITSELTGSCPVPNQPQSVCGEQEIEIRAGVITIKPATTNLHGTRLPGGHTPVAHTPSKDTPIRTSVLRAISITYPCISISRHSLCKCLQWREWGDSDEWCIAVTLMLDCHYSIHPQINHTDRMLNHVYLTSKFYLD